MRKVLIVEDSGATRELLRAALETLEVIEVHTAVNGFDALKVLPRHRFELIITDINMPDINGLELVSFMRRSAPHKSTPVIIISTEASAKEQERGIALGANAFLSKPFAASALQALVRTMRETTRS